MDEQYFTSRNILIIGILVGSFFWWSTRSPSSDAQRSLSTSETIEHLPSRSIKAEYHPQLPVTSNDRADARAAPAAAAALPAANDSTKSGLVNADFVSTRNEITKDLVNGDLDLALDLARQKLADQVGTSNEIAFMGYLQEFILQNSHDQEDSLNVTLSALKATQNPRMRVYLYDKFNAYRPEMREELNRELESSGVEVN